MKDLDKKDYIFEKLIVVRMVLSGAFGFILLATAMTGVHSYDRYIPAWLYIALGVVGSILIILSIVISKLKPKK